jgi:glycosyltransferase involved in cell wall biosynthesis
MNKPLVSVVIPAYNAAKYIEEAVWSIEKQSYSEIEIVVVDDASTDETKNILWDLERHISHKLVVWQGQRNQGAGNALRLGFEVAKGDYVCWLSADDMFVDKDKTRKQVKAMQQTNADWSYYPQFQMGATVTYSKKIVGHYIPHVSFLDNKIERDNGLLFLSLLFHNPMNGSTTMFKRETIANFGTFDATLKRADADGDLWLRYTLLGAKVARVPGGSILYRTHPEQLSRDIETMLYGTEVTRCRALKSIEDTAYCFDALLNKNKWLLYVMFLLKQYKKRPFVSLVLCTYVMKHSATFPVEFVEFCKKTFRKVDMYIENNLSWTLFKLVLEGAMESEEYEKHLERFSNK